MPRTIEPPGSTRSMPPSADAARFAGWWTALGARHPEPARHRLLAAWSEAGRCYHTPAHLDRCLAELDRMRGAARDPAAVEAALWFHDAVCDPSRADNERRSAALAREMLGTAGASEPTVRVVERLVLVTAHDHPPASPDEALTMDIDLAILAAPAAEFEAYDRAIRTEYAGVPEAEYRKRRREVLTGFLKRPRIYSTPAAAAEYESSARRNLAAAIRRLTEPA